MHGDEALAHAVVIRWFTEFLWDRSLLDEEHTGKPLSAVIQNVSAIQKILSDGNQWYRRNLTLDPQLFIKKKKYSYYSTGHKKN